jgi:hypothetical protein
MEERPMKSLSTFRLWSSLDDLLAHSDDAGAVVVAHGEHYAKGYRRMYVTFYGDDEQNIEDWDTALAEWSGDEEITVSLD